MVEFVSNDLCSVLLDGSPSKGYKPILVALKDGITAEPILTEGSQRPCGVRLRTNGTTDTIEIPREVAENIWAMVETMIEPSQHLAGIVTLNDDYEGQHPHDFRGERAEYRRETGMVI